MIKWMRHPRAVRTAVLATLLACTHAVVYTPAAGAIPLPEYQIRFGHDNSKCVDLQFGSHDPGRKVQQWTCATPGQSNMGTRLWISQIFSSGPSYIHPQNRRGGCMNPSHFPAGNGTPVVLQQCEPSLSEWV